MWFHHEGVIPSRQTLFYLGLSSTPNKFFIFLCITYHLTSNFATRCIFLILTDESKFTSLWAVPNSKSICADSITVMLFGYQMTFHPFKSMEILAGCRGNWLGLNMKIPPLSDVFCQRIQRQQKVKTWFRHAWTSRPPNFGIFIVFPSWTRARMILVAFPAPLSW